MDSIPWHQFIMSNRSNVCLPFCTQTFREPVSDYQVVREKAASQRRDVERALTRFMAKTGETESLFKDDITAFPRKRCANMSFTLECVLSSKTWGFCVFQ